MMSDKLCLVMVAGMVSYSPDAGSFCVVDLTGLDGEGQRASEIDIPVVVDLDIGAVRQNLCAHTPCMLVVGLSRPEWSPDEAQQFL